MKNAAAEEEVYATFARMEADRAERRDARAPASAETKRAEPASTATKRVEPATVSTAAPRQPSISSDIFDPSDVEPCDDDEVVGAARGDSEAPADETGDAPAMPRRGPRHEESGFRLYPTHLPDAALAGPRLRKRTRVDHQEPRAPAERTSARPGDSVRSISVKRTPRG